MIIGGFSNGRVVLPVNFYLMEDTSLAIDCVVDTGFNDYLTLPPQAVTAMNLSFYSMTSARLANGVEYQIPVHWAKIRWDEQEQIVPVLATGTKPLLGASLLRGFRLVIEFADDGLVMVEKM